MTSLFDMRETIEALATDTITVQRAGTDSYDAIGKVVRGALGTPMSPILAVVEPARGQEIARLDEGYRTRETYAITVGLELFVRDRVTIEGRGVFEVAPLSENWSRAGMFSRVLVVKV